MKVEFELETGKDNNTVSDPMLPKTFILMWNPGISSYTMERFEDDLQSMAEDWAVDDLDWNLRDWHEAHAGDRFYMVRVGAGTTGIVMSGRFSTEPYDGEDWSGKGRPMHYMGLEIETMLHPERSPIITVERLMSELPDFDWTGGPSGRLLDEASTAKLEKMWYEFVERNEELFKPRAAKNKDYGVDNDKKGGNEDDSDDGIWFLDGVSDKPDF